MANSENTLAPTEGSGGAVDLHGRMEDAKAALGAMTKPEQAHQAEAEANAIREIASAKSPAEAHAFNMHGAELAARAMRRFGELLPEPSKGGRPPKAGGDAETLQRAEEFPPALPPLSAGAITNRRQIASIPIDAFEGALAGARASSTPISQKALLALVPKPPKPDRQVSHLVWLGALLERTCKAIGKRLEDAKGTPEALDVRQVALVIEEIGRRVDARLEDGGPSEIDLRLLGEPDPDADGGDQDDEDEDEEEDEDDGNYDANDGTEGGS